MTRYITTKENGLKDVKTGIVWQYFNDPEEASKAVTTANRINQARLSGCHRSCSDVNTPDVGIFGLPPCIVCHIPPSKEGD